MDIHHLDHGAERSVGANTQPNAGHILEEDAIDDWVYARQSPDSLMQLLRPARRDLLDATPVSARGNPVKNDDPECLAKSESGDTTEITTQRGIAGLRSRHCSWSCQVLQPEVHMPTRSRLADAPPLFALLILAA